MDTVVVFGTRTVFTMKTAVVLPPATWIVAGTVAAELLLDRETVTPSAGAGWDSVNVAVEGLPPNTTDGFNDMVLTAGG